MELLAWQERALAKWEEEHCCGIVEAFPGAGKTILGAEAIASLRKKHGRSILPLVVVPSIVIMFQWRDCLEKRFPDEKIGLYWGTRRDDYSTGKSIIVAVINSIAPRVRDLFDYFVKKGNWRPFLIADECHHYIETRIHGKILRYPFQYTLGLSATIGKVSMLDDYQIKGLGKIVETYNFEHALQDGRVPHFDLVNIAVPFTDDENARWFEIDEKVRDQVAKVKKYFNFELENTPDHLFFHRLEQLNQRFAPHGDPIINKFKKLLLQRASLCYTAKHKQELTFLLSRMLLSANRKALVFFERIDSAEELALRISEGSAMSLYNDIRDGSSNWCEVVHSQMKKVDREQILEEFKNNDASLLISCRSLDEGFNVPAVDGAILGASTQSLRQRIQRIGRTLRKEGGKKRPIIITLFVRGTGDENVCRDDQDIFGSVATIHNLEYGEALSKVAMLLGADLGKGFAPPCPPLK